jgi:hypothetical protein
MWRKILYATLTLMGCNVMVVEQQKQFLEVGLVAGGLMIGGAAPTVVGEVVAVPVAAATVVATTTAAGAVLLYHAIFGSHDSSPKLERGSEDNPQPTSRAARKDAMRKEGIPTSQQGRRSQVQEIL